MGLVLEAFIPENKDLLSADVALVSDTAIVNKDQPAIVYGLRGIGLHIFGYHGTGT